MASILKVDTLTGVSTAGSISVTGEGNSTTTNLQQGLAKAWLNLNGTGTIAARDSFNISSITDTNTGKYAPVLTSAMGNTNYSLASYGNHAGGETFYAGGGSGLGISAFVTTTASTYDLLSYSNAYIDSKYVYSQVFGDLA